MQHEPSSIPWLCPAEERISPASVKGFLLRTSFCFLTYPPRRTTTPMASSSSSSTSVVVSHFCRGFFLAAIISCLHSTTTSALPLTDLISKTMLAAKSPQQQERHKREVTAETDCTETRPSDLQAMFEEINSNTSRVTFLQSDAVTYPPASDNFDFITGDPNESKTCPATLTRDNEAPLAHRSLCPYYFDILRLPKGYYPPTLRWARCKCDQCVENTVYGCEMVMTKVAVLKPVGCYQGMRKYEEHLIDVSTSCACAFNGHHSENRPTTTTTTTPAPGPWVS